MDELERVRGIAGANVAEDLRLRLGHGVRAITASTFGLPDRRRGCCVGKVFFTWSLLELGPLEADLERRRGCVGTGERAFSARL